jgi:hypothetical protein
MSGLNLSSTRAEQGSLQKYEREIEEISRNAGSQAWTPGLAATFYLLLAMLAITIVACFFITIVNFGVTVLVLTVEVVAVLIPVFMYYSKGGRDVDARCLELDRTKPGFYSAYLEWKDKQRENLPDGFMN